MSKLVFTLRNVTEEEADAVRQLLTQNEIEFFETAPGNWGISLPALWLHDAADFARARALIDAYQEQRRIEVRQEYEQRRQRGEGRTIWHSFRESPLRVTIYIGLATLVLYFSVRVFMTF